MRNLSGTIVLLVLSGLLWQTGCTTIPSASTMPPMPTLTIGSVKPLSDEVGHLRHTVSLMEKMFEDNQRNRERSLQQLKSLVEESSGVLKERERRLQSNLGTLSSQQDRKSESLTSQSPQTDQISTMYRKAYSNYQRGDYKVAYERYMQIYDEAPSMAQKGQAIFWAAESAYGLGDWDKAIDTFDKFRREFPADPLIPSALLRTATAHLKKGDSGNSQRVLKTLITQFPKTEEAELARRRLADASSL